MSGMKGNPHAASMDEYADPRNSLEAMATLALAYEQRTANLIALYALEDGWQLALNRVAGMTHGKWDDVANQIVERLGLE